VARRGGASLSASTDKKTPSIVRVALGVDEAAAAAAVEVVRCCKGVVVVDVVVVVDCDVDDKATLADNSAVLKQKN
jgi:hypothetical protein